MPLATVHQFLDGSADDLSFEWPASAATMAVYRHQRRLSWRSDLIARLSAAATIGGLSAGAGTLVYMIACYWVAR